MLASTEPVVAFLIHAAPHDHLLLSHDVDSPLMVNMLG